MVRKYSETHFTLRVKLHDNKADLGIACAQLQACVTLCTGERLHQMVSLRWSILVELVRSICYLYIQGWPEPYIYIYIRCTYGIFGLEITKYTVYIYVYIQFWPTLRYFWQGNPQKYGHSRCICMAVANPTYLIQTPVAFPDQCKQQLLLALPISPHNTLLHKHGNEPCTQGL